MVKKIQLFSKIFQKRYIEFPILEMVLIGPLYSGVLLDFCNGILFLFWFWGIYLRKNVQELVGLALRSVDFLSRGLLGLPSNSTPPIAKSFSHFTRAKNRTKKKHITFVRRRYYGIILNNLYNLYFQYLFL